MTDRLIRNAARCRHCRDVIESTHRHDMRWCSCGAIAVDGGLHYARRCGDLDAVEEMAEWESPGVVP